MKVYHTNAGLGWRELVFLIRLDKTENGHNYLVIGSRNLYNREGYEIGNVVGDLEDFYVEDSNYKVSDSPLYHTFLFKHFIKTMTI